MKKKTDVGSNASCSLQFLRWKSLAPVRQMASRLALDISDCMNWADFTDAFSDLDDSTGGELMKRVQGTVGHLSTGEVPVLLAMLHAADRDRDADKLGGTDNWWRLGRTYGEHAEAVALPIMRY